MARGWESKSVEAQADAAEIHRSAVLKKAEEPAKLELIRRKETILLSRTRVLRELQTAQNPRYRELMNRTLAELNAQLTSLTGL